jgi:hypothetical protein
MKTITDNAKSRLYVSLIIFGISIRAISLLTKGMEDVDVMVNWGINVSNLGWDKGYLAIYFPTSHLIFNAIVEVSNSFNLEVFNLFTVVRLFSDLIFLFLLLYLNKSGFLTKKFVVLIWLNPLLLILTLSGYTDTFSITLLTSSLVFLLIYQRNNNKLYSLLTGIFLGLFLFLKPQTLLLIFYLFFFILIFNLIGLKKEKFLDKFWVFCNLIFPSLFIFCLYSIMLSSPTKLTCGENVGPRTISSLETSGLTEWNVCIEPDQIGLPYPNSGPAICIENKDKAFSPLGGNGFCVNNYKYVSPKSINDYWETGFIKLKNQVINGSAEHMPSYSANMPNLWHIYVVTYLDYDQAREVWSYKAKDYFNKIAWFSILVFVLLYSFLILFTYRPYIDSYLKIISLIGFPITFIVPIFATLAHENHLALGVFFAYLLLNLNTFRNRFKNLFHILIFVISSLMALNIARLYLWPMWNQSNNSILNSVGGILIDLVTIPSIYQISVISTFAALLILTFLPFASYPSRRMR